MSFRWLIAALAVVLSTTAWAARPDCRSPLLDERWRAEYQSAEPLYTNHYRAVDGGWEALVPTGEGAYKVVRVKSLHDAVYLAQGVREPLDLNAIIDERRPSLGELLDDLYRFKGDDDRLAVSARVKDPDSLKAKIFEKARKKNGDFRLSDIDDIVGARIAVPTVADVESTAARLKSFEGLKILKFDPVRYDRGYRAIHVTVSTESGAVFEVQIMTARMLKWVLWNAKRIYKPRIPKNTPYFARLARYDAELVAYLNALDDGARELPPKPDATALGIYKTDQFPPEDLR